MVKASARNWRAGTNAGSRAIDRSRAAIAAAGVEIPLQRQNPLRAERDRIFGVERDGAPRLVGCPLAGDLSTAEIARPGHERKRQPGARLGGLRRLLHRLFHQLRGPAHRVDAALRPKMPRLEQEAVDRLGDRRGGRRRLRRGALAGGQEEPAESSGGGDSESGQQHAAPARGRRGGGGMAGEGRTRLPLPRAFHRVWPGAFRRRGRRRGARGVL